MVLWSLLWMDTQVLATVVIRVLINVLLDHITDCGNNNIAFFLYNIPVYNSKGYLLREGVIIYLGRGLKI